MTATVPVQTDVLVVGAGPAGSAAAAWAARAGLDVLLDRRGGLPARQDLRRRADPARRSASCSGWASRTGCARTPSTRGCGRTASGRPCCCRGPAARCPTWGSAVARTELDDHLRTTAIKAGATALDGARAVDVRVTAAGSRPSCSSARAEPVRDRLPAAGRGRRRPLAARQGARPRVAPRHGVRRRRPLVRRLRDVRRPLDQLPPRAARRGRRDPVRLRLDLPARHRRGEPRRRHPRHRQAPRRRRDQAADALLRRRAARGVRARRRPADADLGAAARWAARCPTSPAPTGR